MTGNIIVSTCCLGDMAVNTPSSSGCALGHGGVYSHITLANMSVQNMNIITACELSCWVDNSPMSSTMVKPIPYPNYRSIL